MVLRRDTLLDMAKLSKLHAAKAIGVSRQTLYSYIDKGRISVDPDGTIDTAELLRAGFTLHTIDSPPPTDNRQELTPSSVNLDVYQDMIELLREQLAEAREREQGYREQITLLATMLQEAQRQSGRLLDLPRQAAASPVLPTATTQEQRQRVRELLRQRRQTENPTDTVPETWQRILAYM
jgi:DNA-binding XRE family transcriptional regulator